MKRSEILLFIFCILLTHLFTKQSVSAQTISESLQKNIWPNVAPIHLATWENMLPSSDQDTVVYSDLQLAEVLTIDSEGRPRDVFILQMIDFHWVLETKTTATFDAHGQLVALFSWKWVENRWENESQTLRSIDPNGNDLSFQVRYWEDGGWTTTYSAKSELAAASPSARLEP